ncbi:MAG: hypothetical protein KJ042_04495 [Deltaproteobacteria bacterium]|nr:hypothetical protein [Deltaproteobacteria bacterium]
MTRARLAVLATLTLCAILASGCGAHPELLVEKTLEARQKALASLDVEGYVALFHPQYRYKPDSTQTILSQTQARFAKYRTIQLYTTNRRITFEQDGEIASVVQEFTLQAELLDGQIVRHSDTEYFKLKRHRRWGLFTEYLFFEGLSV